MKFNSLTKTIFYGLCLGISLLPPGFSVATMAMILGIYEDLIGLLNDLFSKNMAKAVKTIAYLGTGAVLAIMIFSWLISAVIINFPYQTRFFFLGLIIATIPLISKQAGIKTNFTTKHYILLVLATIFTTALIFTNGLTLVELGGDMTIAKFLYLVLAGALVSVSMIVPGFSGALMLMLIGAYEFLLDSISSFNVLVLVVVAAGAIIGLVVGGRLIKYLLENNDSILDAISIGLVIGSVPVLLSQGVPNDVFDIVTSVLLGVLGFTVVTILNRFSRKGVYDGK